MFSKRDDPLDTKARYPARRYRGLSSHRPGAWHMSAWSSAEARASTGCSRSPGLARGCARVQHTQRDPFLAPRLPHPLAHPARSACLDPGPLSSPRLQIILNAKCHAIRDAQILEKQLIQRELDAEERRLDHMMEVERQKAIQRQEELDRKRREERIR